MSKRISELDPAGGIGDNDLLEIAFGATPPSIPGTSLYVTAAELKAYASGIAGGFLNIPAPNIGLHINPGANIDFYKYCAFTSGNVSGSTNIFLPTSIANASVVTVFADAVAVQTSGTPGASGFGMRVRARFRKTNAGLWVIIGSSVQENVDNDTGDSFVGTPALAASGGGGNVNFNLTLTTVKTFSMTVWIEALITH